MKIPKIKNKKRLILIAIGAFLALAIAGGVIVGQIKKPLPYQFEIAKIKNVVQEVSVTGKVKPAQSVDLAFERTGKIKTAPAQIGGLVEEGQILASLDTTELQAQLTQAQANLETQEIALTELEKGARPEEIAVAQTTFDNAQKALTNAQNKAATDLANLYDDVKDTLNDSSAKADNAVNTQTEELFSNDLSSSPTLTFSSSNFQAVINSQAQRVVARDVLIALKAVANNNSTDQGTLDNSLGKAELYLGQIRDFLNTLNTALNAASNLTETTATTYKGYINTGRTNVNTALTSVNTLKQSIISQKITNEQNITSAQNTLESAQKDLILKKALATQEQIQTQEAQIKSAKANVNNIAAQIAKSSIKAPLNGVITKQNAKVGEIAPSSAVIVSLISQADFEIEANVPEADTAKVKIGDTAKITLDAYGSDTFFQAKVIKIDPAETIVEGVATYKTTLQFINNDPRVKSGLTANVNILTAQKENVLAAPYRAIIAKNGDKIIKVLQGKKIIEKKVILGLRGSDGNVEITEGIIEGEKIITFEKKK